MDDIDDIDVQAEIVRLEAQAVELAARIENCRKFILASRAAVALGGAILAAGMLRLVAIDGVMLAGSVVAVLGGIVLSGSNRSTAQEAQKNLAAAELRRAELIELIGPREVGRVLH
jgi:hypothetical protein